MTLSPDRHWTCLGTSRGYISLWDIRYNTMSSLWRHSSHRAIQRLACCKSLPPGTSGVSGMPYTEGAYLFAAAGENEAAVWGIPEGGESYKCFRSVPLDASRSPLASLPVLTSIPLPRHAHAPVREALNSTYGHMHAPANMLPFSNSAQQHMDTTQGGYGGDLSGLTYGGSQHSVRALLGRISQTNASYLITAGTDRCIRYWDFSSPAKCYTVSGLQPAQPKGIFDCSTGVAAGGNADLPYANSPLNNKLFVCYVAETPSADKILQAHLPVREGRGVTLPSANFKVRI
jgi:phosphoinositide-3-kinase regulatory subunit 4